MFMHAIYFWLKPDLTPAQRSAFRQGLETLPAIESLRFCHIGEPADTGRAVVDNSYDFALLVGSDDAEGYEAYLTHPLHRAFADRFRANWDRVQIFDSK